jgi:hypothetical protein
MKTRLDYWHNGNRYPLKLTGYGHRLLADQAAPSAAITTADCASAAASLAARASPERHGRRGRARTGPCAAASSAR